MAPPKTPIDLAAAGLSTHNAAVAGLSKKIAGFHASSTPFRIYHTTTNSTRPSTRTATTSLDISKLNHVLAVSPETRTCLCEPNVPMDALLRATLEHGLMPPVVPEFPGITVGGAFAGTAGESSCFKYGFFDRSVVWIEMVLADGEVVTASADERADLFEITLVPAAKYVELRYLPVRDVEDARAVMVEQGADEQVDFIDGIMFSATRGVILVGKLVDDPVPAAAGSDQKEGANGALPVVTFTKAWDEWFYLHVDSRLADAMSSSSSSSPSRSATKPRDLIPLTDYLFRYDRGAFWTGRYAYWYFITPFTRATRFLLDVFMHTRVMYHALHRSGLMSQFIIQDMAVPASNLRAFSDWLDAECPEIYPRWLCPLREGEGVSMNPHRRNGHQPQAQAQTQAHDQANTGTGVTSTSNNNNSINGTRNGNGKSLIGENSLLNIGLWGPTPTGKDHLTFNRLIEKKLASLGGMKWLYAQTFYTQDEFWAIYDRPWYDALRAKYRATGLPSVYDKVGTSVDKNGEVRGSLKGIWKVWPLAGLWGVGSVVKGGDYLRKA